MNRDVESRLVDFCITQKDYFVQSEWFDFPATDDEKAAVALYLSNSALFRHQRQNLFKVADYFRPGCVGKFVEMFEITDFDPSRFRSLLLARLDRDIRTSPNR